MSTALTSKENDCRSCYKCIRNCPVKSISFSNGQASIIPDECVLCGTCYLVCPQSCKIIRDDLSVAKDLVSSSSPVIASVAPSYLASFPGTSFPKFREALLKIGFADAEETAIGATIVKKEYDSLVDSGKQDIIISTCCHSINLLIEKHFPELTCYLAPVLSPMLAHAKDIKQRNKKAKVIFLGPCIAKKNEIEMYPGLTDCVLTFLELERWFKEKNVVVEVDNNPKKIDESLARLFPVEGGILATMKKDNPSYAYLAIGGMDEALASLKDIASGKVHHAFIEMSSCKGSCINGPAIDPNARALVSSYLSISRSAGKKDFQVSNYSSNEIKKSFPAFTSKKKVFSEEEIEEVLRKIGKTSKKDELNCSSCGYPSCRDKAVAVLEGKATLTMCLPYLMEKATSFGNNIVDTSDNGIVAVDETLKIQLVNPSLASWLNKNQKEMVGKDVAAFLDPSVFALALAGTPIKNRHISLVSANKVCEATVSYEPQFHLITGVFRDITKEEELRLKKENLAKETAKVTSEVVEKNMRAVQEIASLLGESTAETKIALTKLSEALKKEDKNDE